MSEATVITLAAAIIYAGRIARPDDDYGDPLGPTLTGAIAEAEELCRRVRERRPELFEAADV